MTIPYVPPEPSWAEAIGHMLLRLILVFVGYFVSVLVTLIAVVIIYSVLSNFAWAPDRFGAMSVTPFVALVVPWVGGLIYLVAAVLAFVPGIGLALITEIWRLRSIFLHMLIGAAVSGGTFAYSAPTLLEGNGPITDWRDVWVMAGGGLFGGIAYWLIAGSRAGIRIDRPKPILPGAPPARPS